MKISIDRADLLRSLGHVYGVVERRNTIPILANVLMKASEGCLMLTTCDMDIEICESVQADIEKEGATTVPVHTFHDIVRKLPDDSRIELEVDPEGARMEVRSGRSKFKLSCLPVSDFPSINDNDFPIGFEISAEDLRAVIDRTRFAMSTEETRYYLNGIYLHTAENGETKVLRTAATDGLRLARFEMPLPEGAEDMPGIIIPRKTVGEIRKLLEDAADTVEVRLSQNKIRFELDQIVLTSKLIDGTFPDYEKVIPLNNDKIVEVDPKVFASAIDRVAIISDAKSRAVKLAMSGNVMTISASSPEAGSATEEIETRSETESIEIGFNSRYLLDIAGQMDDEGCRITLSDSGSAVKIESTSDSSVLYVIMPMRV